jgi:hypothetical protein
MEDMEDVLHVSRDGEQRVTINDRHGFVAMVYGSTLSLPDPRLVIRNTNGLMGTGLMLIQLEMAAL